MRYLQILLLVLLSTNLFAKRGDIKSVFVYYGFDMPYTIAGGHDAIIVEPSHIETLTHRFNAYKDKIYAYVSIGESEKKEGDWIIGENEDWKSYISDITNRNYQNYLLNKIEKLHKRGFKNFFFDTLDSYHLVIKDKEELQKHKNALATFIKTFKVNYPNSKLILNRGFDVIEETHSLIDAFLVESLFYGIDTQKRAYKKMSEDDTKWLLNKLESIKNYDLDIIILDYIQQNKKELINQTIKQIANLGFTPYISTIDLNSIGKSTIEPIKREILILFDSKFLERNDEVYSNAYQTITMPLEYFGYIPVFKDIRKDLDRNFDRYAAIVVQISDEPEDLDRYYKWILDAKSADMKILFLGDPSLPNSSYLQNLGINVEQNKGDYLSKYEIIAKDKMIGFELEPVIRHRGYFYTPINAKTLLSAKNKYGQISTLSAITSWGGYALSDSFYQRFNIKKNRDEIKFFTIDVFELLKKALRLKEFPIPDVTTKNGRRVLFIHMDGDGFVSGVEFSPSLKISGKEYIDSILKKYALPHSISIIEAEVAKHGVYQKFSDLSMKTAKEIFNFPYVEAASHTFTHPFVWSEIESNPTKSGYNLPVPNYTFSAKREIKGSLDFINKNLTSNKKAKTIFWSGDCLPSAKVLKYLNSQGFLAINGGGTKISKIDNSVSVITPIGIKRGDFYQIYAATENENVYTNNWKGPFWGYENVIQTFKMLEKPRRLKPINIYYHFYIASKRASLKSLQNVYDWVLTQEINPIFVTEYILKAHNYYYMAIAKKDDSYIIKGANHLDNLRIPKSLQYIDLKNSNGVYGFRDSYIHLNTKANISLKFKNNKEKNSFYLIDTNGEVKNFSKNQVSIDSNVPIVANFFLPNSCKITSSLSKYKTKKSANILSIESKNLKDLSFSYQCN